jgi:hypothetical protein
MKRYFFSEMLGEMLRLADAPVPHARVWDLGPRSKKTATDGEHTKNINIESHKVSVLLDTLYRKYKMNGLSLLT